MYCRVVVVVLQKRLVLLDAATLEQKCVIKSKFHTYTNCVYMCVWVCVSVSVCLYESVSVCLYESV